MNIWLHISGRLYLEVGAFGPWLKLVPKDKPDSAPYYVDSEFLRFYTLVELQ